ncbi:hypothetical protein BRC81_07345 [Halobacteriales archaeon QS_1_68_20]|nr:MAG: hypothetical protein BRC81_07345 [Halobacteriales archaeon QS_1_68_20]
MSQDTHYDDRTQGTDGRPAPELASGVEALGATPEFQGPVDSPDGHDCNDHLALIYEDEAEQLASLVPFIRQGLVRGEHCVCLVDDLSEETLVDALRDADVDVDEALASGALSFREVGETYLRNGTFDPDEMIEFYAGAIEEATAEYEALRVTAETTWLQEESTSIRDFIAYEAKVNDLFEGEDCIGICQYDRDAFDPAVVRDIVKTHPHLIYDGTVCHNFYYTPPSEFFGPDEPAREVDRMLGTVVDRTRAKTVLEEREQYLRDQTDVTADPDRSFEEKLRALFELGRERFGVDLGTLNRADADRLTVEHVGGDHDHFEPGVELPLSETYCQAAADARGFASVADPAEEGRDDVTVYDDFGVRSYLGTYVPVDGGTDRTLGFVGSEPRTEPFSEQDRTYLELMGQWVKHELERRQRERQLQQHKEYTDDLLDAIDDVFYVLDEAGNLKRWNESTAEVTGYSDAELDSKPGAEFFDDEDRTAVADAIAEVFETGNARVDASLSTSDGESIPYELAASALEDPTGEPVLTGIGRNLSDRVERETALREERDRFASLFESIPEAAVNVRLEGGEPVVREVNSAFGSTFGYDPDRIVGESLNDLIVPPGREDEAERIDEVVSNGQNVAREVRRETADGMRDFLFRGQQFEREDGTVEGLGVYVDITERKQRERDLELFRSLLDRSNDAVFVIDTEDGSILDVNDTACHRLGYDREQLLSKRVSEIERWFSVDENWEQHVENLRERSTSTFEGIHERRDGTTFPVEVSAAHVELDREYVLAIARDVTERKERERVLRRLYETAADADLSFEAKIDRLLALGREQFGFDYGMLTRVVGDYLDVVQSVGGFEEHCGEVPIPLEETYCRKVLLSSDPVGVADAPAEGWDEGVAYERIDLDSYLGTSVTLGDEIYGTLCFASETTRDRSFTDAEYTFLELMGQWVSYEVERDHREAQLSGLNGMSRDLMDAETTDDIAERTVEHARRALDLPLTAVAGYDGEIGTLSTVAQTPRADDELPMAAMCDPETGTLWDGFVAQETRRVDDVASIPGAGDDLTEVVAVPLGRVGSFVTATRAPGGFSDAEVDFLETTGLTVEAACDRSKREQQLQERERTLEEQNETLERLNRVNDIIRSIDQALVGASTRGEIETVVCEHLADVGPYELAWVGDHDPVSGEVVPSEWAGTERGYLDGISITADDGPHGRGPAGRAVRTREPQVVNDVLGDPAFEPWRQDALNRGYHSTIALPLVYEDSLYGVLTVYAGQPGVFDELEQSVLAELSDTIAYAVNAVESKKALVSDQVTELEFEVRDTGMAAVDLARETGCCFTFESMVPRSDGGLRGFFSTRGADAEEVLTFLDDVAAGDVTLIAEREDDDQVCLFEVLLTDESFCGYVLEHGGKPRTISVVDGVATIVIELAAEAPIREFVDTFGTRYPDSELKAQRTREREQYSPTEFDIAVTGDLTARQREALETAYFSGYFERPRERTGSEIAEAMDISQPTFNYHLRAAHRKLCRRLFECDRTDR